MIFQTKFNFSDYEVQEDLSKQDCQMSILMAYFHWNKLMLQKQSSQAKKFSIVGLHGFALDFLK